jgi:hypothetical protein
MSDDNVINAYCYGSRVYGTNRNNSDYDYIFVVKQRMNEQYSDNQINVNFFTLDGHKQRIEDHEISALECVFLDKMFILKETIQIPFKLDISKLRHSLSRKSSNSWVKCKKKLTIPEDYDLDLGRKSMFHSFRILNFGIQIATMGRIVKYDDANLIYDNIMKHYDWNELFDEFKKEYNVWCSNFRSVTHK